MKPQEPFYFELVNRTAWSFAFVSKYGSDFPDTTKGLKEDSSHVLRPGQTSGNDFGVLAASGGGGTQQWGHLYFNIFGDGLPVWVMVLYVHSENPDSFACAAAISPHGSWAQRPHGRWNVPGTPVGHVSRKDSGRYWFPITGGDISSLLRHYQWVDDVVKRRPELENAPLSRWKIPGSHDACTFGSGLAEANWKCQDFSLNEQMDRGIRYFDIRLRASKSYSDHTKNVHDNFETYEFVPYHGLAMETPPHFADDLWDIGRGTLAETIVTWAKAHPTEIIILAISPDFGPADADGTGGQARGDFAKCIYNHLGQLLVSYPEDQHTPTYREILNSGRNVILYSSLNDFNKSNNDVARLVDERKDWKVPGLLPRKIVDWSDPFGEEDPLYNDRVWKSGDPSRVIDSIESYIRRNSDEITNHRKIWGAQVQLIPSIDLPGLTLADIARKAITFANSPSYSPRHLAKETNPEMKWRVPDSMLLQQGGNIVSYDFAENEMSSAIITMNFF